MNFLDRVALIFVYKFVLFLKLGSILAKRYTSFQMKLCKSVFDKHQTTSVDPKYLKVFVMKKIVINVEKLNPQTSKYLNDKLGHVVLETYLT